MPKVGVAGLEMEFYMISVVQSTEQWGRNFNYIVRIGRLAPLLLEKSRPSTAAFDRVSKAV